MMLLFSIKLQARGALEYPINKEEDMKEYVKHSGIRLEKGIAVIIIIAGLMTVVGIILACAPPQKQIVRPLPTSQWGGNYSYSYKPPEQKAPVSVRATIAIVNPYYKEAESALKDPTYSEVAKGFSKSMAVDIDKIIVAKGMTVKGPFATIEDITYPDKKGSDLTLTPRVFITTQIKNGAWQVAEHRMDRNFEMNVGGWIAFEIREPLSNEKIWIKRLELENIPLNGIEVFEAVPARYEWREGFLGRYKAVAAWKTGKALYEGKKDAMADALKNVYPTIMEKFWTYINTNEILYLKTKTKEIRDLKRY